MSLYNEQPLQVPCLGRPMELGMLYDCRSENIIPGVTLWNKATLQNNSVLKMRENSQYEIITEDSLDRKAHSLDINASIKLSLLGGLISLEGSAKYLDNKKTSHRQARVTLKYMCSTFFEQLTMDQLAVENIQYKDVFDKGTATHVVTGVQYGSDAVFVFDRELSSSEDTRTVEGFLKATIDKIPCLSLEAQADVKINEDEEMERNKFRCTFHGDLFLPQNPTTFVDAVTVYRDLPKFIKDVSSKSGEIYGVPKKVYLYPLSKLDSKAARLVRNISDDLVNQTCDILDSLSELKVTANDLKTGIICQRFPGIQKQVTFFVDLISRFVTDIQRQLASILPRIRGGGAEEVMLAEFLGNLKKSPFGILKLTDWLEAKQEEASILEQHIEPLNDCAQFASQAGELEKHTHNRHVKHVLALCLGEIISQSHPFLENLTEYLSNMQDVSESRESCEEHWFDDPDIINRLKKQCGLFAEFVSANKADKDLRCIVVAKNSRKSAMNTPGDFLLFTDGSPEVFHLPSSPGIPKLAKVNENDSIELKWEAPKFSPENVQKYYIAFQAVNNNAAKNWSYMYSESNEPHSLFTTLQPNTLYVFKVAVVCKAGKSKFSALSQPLTSTGADKVLQPPSRPGRPELASFNGKEIELKWGAPEAGRDDILNYEIAYASCNVTCDDTSGNWNCVNSKLTKPYIRLTALERNTLYVFKVAAISEGGKSEYSPLSQPLNTSGSRKLLLPPSTPRHPELESFNEQQEIELKWDAPETRPEDILKYVVAYTRVGNTPCDWQHEYSESREPRIRLCLTERNASYIIEVAAITEGGKSNYSPRIRLGTKTDDTGKFVCFRQLNIFNFIRQIVH